MANINPDMRERTFRYIFYLFVAWIIFFSLAPIFWLLLTSLSSDPARLTTTPLSKILSSLTLKHYIFLFKEKPILIYLRNSAIVATATTVLTVAIGTLAAYAFARVKTPTFKLLKNIILLIGVFPGIVLLVPLFGLIVKMGLYDNLLGLILVYTAFNLPFAIWVLSRFFEMLPKDIEDAALLDGFSKPEIVFRFVIPMSLPAISSVSLLTFMAAWNEFLFALAFIPSQNLRTIPVGIATLTGISIYEIPWGEITAAVMIAIIPLIIATLILEKWIVYGLTAGAVKG